MASKPQKKVPSSAVKMKVPDAKAASLETVRASLPSKEPPHAKARANARAVHAKASPSATAHPRRRRDATGHLDDTYAADLHSKSLASADDHAVDRAFLRDSKTLQAPLAEELGREAVLTMTTAEDQSDRLQDVELELEEETGGPFVPTTPAREFARGTDRSNPVGATREPFPRT